MYTAPCHPCCPRQHLQHACLAVQGLGFEEMQGELQSWTADEKAALAEALGAGGASNRGKQLRHARVRLADAR